MPFGWEFENQVTYRDRQTQIEQQRLQNDFRLQQSQQQQGPPVLGGLGEILGGLGRATEGPRGAAGGLINSIMDVVGAGPGASQAMPPAPGMGRGLFGDRPLPPPGGSGYDTFMHPETATLPQALGTMANAAIPTFGTLGPEGMNLPAVTTGPIGRFVGEHLPGVPGEPGGEIGDVLGQMAFPIPGAGRGGAERAVGRGAEALTAGPLRNISLG